MAAAAAKPASAVATSAVTGVDTSGDAAVASVVGILADLQFADVPNRFSHGGVERHYRDSINKVKSVAAELEGAGVDHIIHAGDVIDGQAKGSSRDAMIAMRDGLRAAGKPVSFAIGNHELYHLPRSVVHPLLGLPDRDIANSSFCIGPVSATTGLQPVRVVILDSFDIGVFGRDPSHPKAVHARKLCAAHNSNASFNDPTGLEGLDQRWVGFNGAISDEQLSWFRAQVEEAAAQGQRVVVITHVPLHPNAANPKTLAWNFDAPLHIIAHHSNVVAVISGHDHTGGYTVDINGVHHIVLPGLIELPPGELAHLILTASWDEHSGRPQIAVDPRGAASRVLGLMAQPLPSPRAVLAEGLAREKLAPMDSADTSKGFVVDWSRGNLCCHDLESFLGVASASAEDAAATSSGKALLEVVARAWDHHGFIQSEAVPSRLLSVAPEAETHGHVDKAAAVFAPWTAASVSTVYAGEEARGRHATEGTSAYAAAAALPQDKEAAAKASPSVIGLYPAMSAERAVHAAVEVGKIGAINLSHNPLHGVGASGGIWTAMSASLKRLSLESCNLTAVPEALAPLTGLSALNLSNNMIESLPEWASTSWAGLQSLDVSGNALNESALAQIGKLASLRVLKLADNDGASVSGAVDGDGVLAGLRAAGCEILL